ncbi:acetoin utilization protein AcuC [Pseudokineococcus marinus]|uniref:Acetoin utilization protein AcuC n=1 Tax=Pseudokineococcus marinus TaxID=351215 RepID=A0A849BWL7_9ACTN|nr:acetoin utilization protein AcuC [Pseudokineococcus marinus]NNH23866.1 acetoin utilization protein AcuC [Pseudokineococcus marinus]
MTSSTRVVWDPVFTAYDFGPDHPMSPMRLELTVRLLRELGVLDRPGLDVRGSGVADDALLHTVHLPEYVEAVRRVSEDPRRVDVERGLGTEDDPAFAGMHEASARILAASVECAEEVWRGDAAHAVNFTGGLHHAMAGRASGFCVYNDVAAAIRRLLDAGARRVAYVDVDVHHGDGVQAAFWDDPRVLTVSLHQSGRTLFPGTGFPDEVGGPGAEGSAANVALPPGTRDAAWLRALHAVAHPLVRAFEPDVLVTQHGCDSHQLDPLADLAVSVDAQRAAADSLHELAHEVCDGRWLATGGGGYAVVDVVPRTWSHVVAVAAHAPIRPSTPVPEPWRDHVRRTYRREAPLLMGDAGPGEPEGDRPPWYRPWSSGHDPEDAVDRAVLATRSAVFPAQGLDPWFD